MKEQGREALSIRPGVCSGPEQAFQRGVAGLDVFHGGPKLSVIWGSV